MADDDSMIGAPIAVPTPGKVVLTPDEGIAGAAFTLVDTGLLGSFLGANEGYLFQPAPEPSPPPCKEQPKKAADESDGALAKYLTGDELPQIGGGGGIFSGLLPDGSVTAPALAFIADTDTGLYRIADDTLGFAAGGVERLRIGVAEVVFNEGGVDQDFRLEGDTEPNLLFVDASVDRVGIGTSTPSTRLHVKNAAVGINSTLILQAAGNGSGDGAMLDWTSLDASVDFRIFSDALNSTTRLKSAGTLVLHFSDTAVSSTNPGITVTGGSGEIKLHQFCNVGTATDATTQGSFASGITGAARMWFSQAEGVTRFYNPSGNVAAEVVAGAGATILELRGSAIQSLIDFSTDLVSDNMWRIGTANSTMTPPFDIVSSNVTVGRALRLNHGTGGDGVVINDLGADYDFRVESDALSNMLFIDASLDMLWLGNTSQSTGNYLNFDQRQTILTLYDFDPANETPSLYFSKSRSAGVVTANDGLGEIRYSGYNSTPAETLYCQHFVLAQVVTAGSEMARWDMNMMVAGTRQTMLQFNGNSRLCVFNEDGVDFDFRVEGDTNANLFFLDASVDKIGVGTATPAARFHIVEPTAGNEAFRLETVATNDDPNFKFFQNRVATTDATVTTIQTISTASGNDYNLTIFVVARRTDGGATQGAGYQRNATLRNEGGVLVQIGATSTPHTAEDAAAWDVTIVISGTDILVRVTGAAGSTITWHSTVIVQNVGT